MAGQTVADAFSWMAEPLGDWAKQGACHSCDPSINFFPTRGDDTRPAKKVCADCPVRDECLTDALADALRQGIWGGTSFRQRRLIRQAQRGGQPAALPAVAVVPARPSARVAILAIGVPAGQARCRHCLEPKPFSEFPPGALAGFQLCRDCKRAYNREQYLRQRGRATA